MYNSRCTHLVITRVRKEWIGELAFFFFLVNDKQLAKKAVWVFQEKKLFTYNLEKNQTYVNELWWWSVQSRAITYLVPIQSPQREEFTNSCSEIRELPFSLLGKLQTRFIAKKKVFMHLVLPHNDKARICGQRKEILVMTEKGQTEKEYVQNVLSILGSGFDSHAGKLLRTQCVLEILIAVLRL